MTQEILTKRELNVVDKKLKNKKLTQQDSNYLSRYVRPKLKAMSLIDSKALLNKLEYNQKTPAIEKYIKNLILKNIKHVSSITIYGSAIYNNYKNYNDIDVLITVKKQSWKKLREKYLKINKLRKEAKRYRLDLELYTDRSIYLSYPSNPSLIYQLKDRKTIYGTLKIPSKIEIPKLEIRMKMDYSMIDENPSGLDIYKAIRNLWLVNLILNKTVDNLKLKNIIEDELGKNLINRLRLNNCSKTDKKIAILYLNQSLKNKLKEINKAKWEKIAL